MKKTKTPPIATAEEFRAVVDSIATVTLKREQIALELEDALAAIRAEYAPLLEPLDKERTEQFKRATKFAVLKRSELFANDTKTSVTALAEFGFRDGNGTLTLLDGFAWEDVVDAIQLRIDELGGLICALHPQSKRYTELQVEYQRWHELIITKTSPVKDQIKACLTDAERAQIGTEIEKKESFWIEPKREKQAKLTEVDA